MKRILMFSAVALLLMPAWAQQAEVPALGFAEQAQNNEEELYRAGTNAMNQGNWQSALDNFSQVTKLNGRRAEGAMYWTAYAQNKLGRKAAALETLAAFGKQYPRSTWQKDARALEVDIRGASAAGTAPATSAGDDEDIKLYAVNALMSMDSEQAEPLLEKVLGGNASAKIKERALFVLSQSGSPRAQELMGKIARGQAQPELQTKAIRNLGISGQRKLLGEIYGASTSADAKRAVLQALGICGGREELLAAARGEKDAHLRNEAIRGLAIAGGREELRSLYKEATDASTKRELIRSAVISGDQQFLLNAMQNEPDVDVKREAVRTLGVTGGRNTTDALVNIYNTDKDKRIRDAAIDGLFVHGDAHSLVELAKKETDHDMRRRLVEKLSVMGSKEATDYLMQLLEK